MHNNKSGGLATKAKRFLNNTGGGTYSDKNVKSIGGRIGSKQNFVGGTIGVAKGKPFGSYNVNGKVKGSFGPQGD